MEKYITDERTRLKYELVGDYYLIAGDDEPEKRPIGIWGQRHLQHLKQRRRAAYTDLLISGKLNDYLADLTVQAEDTATVLIDTLLLILIEIIEIVTQMPDIMLLSPDLRDAARNIEQYRADYHFLSSNGIHTVAELSENIADIKAQISSLEAERSKADNVRRRAHTPEERQAAKERRKAITKEISPLREQLKRAEKIMEESPHLYELLQQEHDLERVAVRKLERSR